MLVCDHPLETLSLEETRSGGGPVTNRYAMCRGCRKIWHQPTGIDVVFSSIRRDQEKAWAAVVSLGGPPLVPPPLNPLFVVGSPPADQPCAHYANWIRYSTAGGKGRANVFKARCSGCAKAWIGDAAAALAVTQVKKVQLQLWKAIRELGWRAP